MSTENEKVNTSSSNPSSPTLTAETKNGNQRHIITKIHESKKKRSFYSFEFYPPKTQEGAVNLYSRMERMAVMQPLFIDVTWDCRSSRTRAMTMEVVKAARSATNTEVMLHLTCAGENAHTLRGILEEAKSAGIRNILALRGDCVGMGQHGFDHAIDLVKFIRATYDDFFGIAVAGYPDKHSAKVSAAQEIAYLKDKVDAGADFIITQQFHDATAYLNWLAECRKAGITCPVIPGIMPIQSQKVFKQMAAHIKVPAEVMEKVEEVKDDDAQVKELGISLAADTIKQLLESPDVPGVHFYTLNLERSVRRVLEVVNLVVSQKDERTVLPWSNLDASCRKEESVRPIYWSNRPLSYMDRTHNWDEFPNGRWGDASSPAFGDFQSYHHDVKFGSTTSRLAVWGLPQTESDVFNTFVSYLEGTIDILPWCDTKLQHETVKIMQPLIALNKQGYLTINSQPRVNGEDSSNFAVGWGGSNGFVYQKAYLEFFCSLDALNKLVAQAKKLPWISYDAFNAAGDNITNLDLKEGHVVNALTWGVFPNREVIQPTVADHESFRAWKDEAFSLWKTHWQSIYSPNACQGDVNPEEKKASYNLLEAIHDSYYLVTVVDNDYVKGDIFKLFQNN